MCITAYSSSIKFIFQVVGLEIASISELWYNFKFKLRVSIYFCFYWNTPACRYLVWLGEIRLVCAGLCSI
ncbi:hypothetical protein RJT34_13262 [Clitoria ternatea]|uniref:Uncharacterized protein n=1 Tax=Clitoria ternatea TaxID=43366 RepID=A0AAN9PLN4_CLITE